jgi:hypothetical protein
VETTLDAIFPSATQDSISITIPKADLLTLIPEELNKADQIIVALLKTLMVSYTQAARDSNDAISIVVTESRPPTTESQYKDGVPAQTYLVRNLEIKLYSPYEQPPLSASDY